MGKAIVSTALGTEGIEAVPGRDLFVEDEPAAFADAVNRLLAEPGLAARIGHSARQLAEESTTGATATPNAKPRAEPTAVAEAKTNGLGLRKTDTAKAERAKSEPQQLAAKPKPAPAQQEANAAANWNILRDQGPFQFGQGYLGYP